MVILCDTCLIEKGSVLQMAGPHSMLFTLARDPKKAMSSILVSKVDRADQPNPSGMGEPCGGHSSRCFSFVKDWVEKKIRRHLMRARKRKGFGWQRWSRQWLYRELGLFNAYRVRRPGPKAQPAG
jgi:RNA-directed DNA polymerase